MLREAEDSEDIVEQDYFDIWHDPISAQLNARFVLLSLKKDGAQASACETVGVPTAGRAVHACTERWMLSGADR